MNNTLRQSWMSLLAKAPAQELFALWERRGYAPTFEYLRPPEQGAVMVQARTGATGAAFNLGEMTVTRCALKLADGRVGHGYVQGRDKRKVEIAALLDALMQGAEAADIDAEILTPLHNSIARAKKTKAEKAEATKVSFFTLARGED
ncbi:phosphonate C-P lyase system protein PhnG [Falsihalocynthiibacter sp. SS001]|uniref:phosphonate C-P lyase system protein PhnG n=1 Tax=Falsihalocynthiibacter sp. SS001 TaxID=3349698 RepID=UPI0036D374A9